MTLNLGSLRGAIENKIDELAHAYDQNKGLILSEGDLKCHIFKKLTEITEFAEYSQTRNHGIKSIPVHSEIS